MENHLRPFELKTVLKSVGQLIVVLVLTVLTQTGGLIYVLWKVLKAIFSKQLARNRLIRLLGFPLIYLIINLTLTPLLATYLGRVALPILEHNGVKPATIVTCILNRHYVTNELKNVTFDACARLQKQHPTTQLIYFDANFPFLDGFPLLPHWSHSDGKKLDLAFIYADDSGTVVNNQPTHFGYGSFEPALENETNTVQECASKGYFQYSALKYFTWFPNDLVLHQKATSDLVKILHQNTKVDKIFIEPHLKNRWNLGQYHKVRFHGCHAVRHDDHIHFQIK